MFFLVSCPRFHSTESTNETFGCLIISLLDYNKKPTQSKRVRHELGGRIFLKIDIIPRRQLFHSTSVKFITINTIWTCRFYKVLSSSGTAVVLYLYFHTFNGSIECPVAFRTLKPKYWIRKSLPLSGNESKLFSRKSQK